MQHRLGVKQLLSEHTLGLCLQVISALSVACSFLLVRTVFGLLSIDHHQYSNDPKLLYTLEVLPEMIALYIVAIPGFIPGIGRDAETHLGIAPTGTHASTLQVKVHHEDVQMGSEEEASHQGKLVSVSQDHASHDHVIDAHPRASECHASDVEAVHEQQPDQGNFCDSPTVLAGTAPLIQQQISLQLRGSSPIAWAASAPVSGQ